jgi:hypothetical protein
MSRNHGEAERLLIPPLRHGSTHNHTNYYNCQRKKTRAQPAVVTGARFPVFPGSHHAPVLPTLPLPTRLAPMAAASPALPSAPANASTSGLGPELVDTSACTSGIMPPRNELSAEDDFLDTLLLELPTLTLSHTLESACAVVEVG